MEPLKFDYTIVQFTARITDVTSRMSVWLVGTCPTNVIH